MTYFKKIIGEKCYLSPIRMEDAEKYTAWLNDFDIEKSLFLTPMMITLEGEKEMLKKLATGSDPNFAIINKNDDSLLGNCGLKNVDNVNRTAEIGVFIGDKTMWNKGFAAEAMRLMLDYGFNLLNLQNIMLTVYAFNKNGIACYKKIGFKEIGRRRGAKCIAGKAHDIVYMDILSTEFESPFVKKFFD